jgi:hypothetical protein
MKNSSQHQQKLLLLLLLQAAELKAAGIDKVVAVTVAPPQEVAQWAAQHGFDKADMVRDSSPAQPDSQSRTLPSVMLAGHVLHVNMMQAGGDTVGCVSNCYAVMQPSRPNRSSPSAGWSASNPTPWHMWGAS